jgi:hypothetical protein
MHFVIIYYLIIYLIIIKMNQRDDGEISDTEAKAIAESLKRSIDSEWDKIPKGKLLVIPNKDKKFHAKWTKGRDMLNFPHPWRAVISGPPNKGKTNIIKNLIIRAKPAFENIIVIHHDPNTQEYKEITDTCMGVDDMPTADTIDRKVKNLVILDDLEYKHMKKAILQKLDRLFGYVSTHCNVSVIVVSQDPFNIPPCIRRMRNILICFKGLDLDSQYALARKSGINKNTFNECIESLTDYHDSLWLDSTNRSPYPIRKNGYEILE